MLRDHLRCGNHSGLLRPSQGDGQVRRKDSDLQGRQLWRCRRLGVTGWGLGIGKYTVAPAKPKFKYFGVAWVGPAPKAGTYKKGEFVVTFFLPGKSYSVIGSPLGAPAMKVTATKGARKATFTGLVNGVGPPISGSWSC